MKIFPPSEFNASQTMRSGSVLLEFVVVCPLYLLLLGGLFLVADLAVNRIRMHIGDELVTWVGSSRFCPQDGSGNRDASRVADLLTPLFERSIGGAVIGFKVDTKEEALWCNDFMSCYSGGIVNLPIRIPDWVRGLMSISDLMSGEAGREGMKDSEIKMDCTVSRTVVFSRNALSGIDGASNPDDASSRDRSISARDIVIRGYAKNVVNGPWIHLEDDSSTVSLDPPQDVPTGRILGIFGE